MNQRAKNFANITLPTINLLGLYVLILATLILLLSVHADDIANEQKEDRDSFGAFDATQGITVDSLKGFSVAHNDSVEKEKRLPSNIDANGYILYCPCMGRFGNQAEQLIGALAFAKGLNRTLVVPPWIVYPPTSPFNSERVRFSRWFSVGHLKKFHKVITMEVFMKDLAPKIWPEGKRYGFCYVFRNGKSCGMKDGNPFGPFWDHFGVSFDGYFSHPGLLWNSDEKNVADEWLRRFPPSQYLVFAFQGSPGDYPSRESSQGIQKYLTFSDHINKLSDEYIIKEMRGEDYVAIHLRNGADMTNVCAEIKKQEMDKLFCSQQCTGYRNERKLTYEMCAPSKREIIRKVKKYLKKLEVKRLFIGTDSDPMIKEFKKAFKEMKVSFYRREAHDETDGPIVDIAIMSKATYFIGNCVSSFSSFIRRQRNVAGRPVAFFGLN